MKSTLARLLLCMTLCALAPVALAFKMEVAAFTIAATSGASPSFTTRTFQQTYPVPPVVFILSTNQGSAPALVRIRNVTTTGFQAVVVEDPGSDGPHEAMAIQYFAIEPGVHAMNVIDQVRGARVLTIEAGRLSTSNVIACTAAPSACTGSYASQSFDSPFAAQPVVLADLQTFVNGASGVPPAAPRPFITATLNNVTASGFDYAIDRHEVTAGSLTPAEAAQEEIGYVAFDGDIVAADFTANNAAAVLVELETIAIAAGARNATLGWDNGCLSDIAFSKSLPSRHVFAAKQTRRENDGGWLRRCRLVASSMRVVVDEDVAGDAERRKGLSEGLGVVVFSRAFFFDSQFGVSTGDPNFKIEADTITLTPGTPATVRLRQFYEQPPAVFLLIDSSNPQPTAVRVTGVTTDAVAGTTSFTAVAVEPQGASGGVPSTPGGSPSSVHYIAVDKGVFQFPDGTQLEVGERSISAVQQGFAGTDSFQTVTLGSTFPAAPVVLAQIIGDANNAADPAVPWLTVAYATNSTTTTSFQIALERSEVNAGGAIANPETVAYFAIKRGLIGSFVDNAGAAVKGESQFASLNGTANAGWDNICFDNTIIGIPFLNTYSSPPLVVAHEMSHRNGDGGWQRRCNLTNTHVRIAEDEDQYLNAERSHPREETGLVAFSQPFDVDFSFIAWYQMEEPVWNSGAVGQVANAVGATLDGTPNDNAQTARSTPAFTNASGSTCRYGQFDGAANVAATADGVDAGNADLGLRDKLSVSAWIRWAVNPLSGNPRAVYVQNDRATNFDDVQFALRGSANDRAIEFIVKTVSGTATARTGNLVAVNTWYHVTGVYDGVSAMIYVDDALEDARARTGAFVAFNTNRRLTLGRSVNAGSNFHGLNGLLDEVRIYRRALSLDEIRRIRQITRPCASGYDHYALNHVGAGGGYGVTCAAEAVTISAHDLAHGAAAPPGGTEMTITATPGDSWALGAIGNAASFSNLGGGIARYVFDGSETQVELRLSRAQPAVVAFSISDTGGRVIGAGEAPALEFRDAILRFAPVGTQIARKPSDFSVQVVRDDGTGTCQAAVPPPGTVDFAFECFNPATGCTGATTGTVAGVSVRAFDQGAATPLDSVGLSFDGTSTAAFQAQYNDAGLVSLKGSASVGTPAATVAGATNPFAVRPFALRVDVAGNPAATSATSAGVFRRAGETFSVALTAVAWDAADDSAPLDGVADGHEAGEQVPTTRADLDDNAPTQNYRTETLAPDGRALLGSYLFRPSTPGAQDPGLSDSGATPLRIGPFTGAGASSATLTFDEVGIIEIEAVQTGDYLGIGAGETANIRGVSGAVGRFIPAWFEVSGASHFDLRNGRLGQPWTCGFTYTGQDFEYLAPPVLTIATRTASGALARNYARAGVAADDFFKFIGTLAGRSHADQLPAGHTATFAQAAAPAAATVSAETDFDGSFELRLQGEAFRFDKGAIPDLPFAPTLALTVPADDLVDGDGVCQPATATVCNTGGPDARAEYRKSDITTAGVEMRFGRLVLTSAAGSELLPLALPARVEYYAAPGGGAGVFVANTDDAPNPASDTCTLLDSATAIRLSGASGEQGGDAVVPLIGSGGTSVLIDAASGSPPAPDLVFGSGLATLVFAPPTPAGNNGYIDVRADLGSLRWLQYDWDGDGSFDDDPTARASFGLFPGRREIIYLREPWD